MKSVKSKKKFIDKVKYVGTMLAIIAMRSNICLAEDSIQTTEVEAATDNIQRVITSIAMPLGRSINFCKCCNCCIKNDC